MPKAGDSKKRKRESKKDEEHDAKKAKSKENDGPHEVEDKEQDCTNVFNLPFEEQQEIDDIDEKLEQNAAKNNLTTINVKSILHVSSRIKSKRPIMFCCN